MRLKMFNWCHGPSCHNQTTLDRVRGSKGNKVLRTRKIKVDRWNENHFFRFFCSNHCYNTFANQHINEIIAIAPRREALETPIEDPKKETNNHGYYNYNRWTIEKKEVDNV